MVTEQCAAMTKAGTRCKCKVVIGLPYCHLHRGAKEHLKIAPSHIPHGGKGLFAADKTLAADAIVFRKNDTVAPYDGEHIDGETVNSRYGGGNPSYVVGTNHKNEFIDAALKRTIGAIPNHSTTHQNAKLLAYGKKVRVVAIKSIRNGQEILVNYGRGYKLDDGSFHSSK
jgi:histone-lysine N-methyltransferase EZH2